MDHVATWHGITSARADCLQHFHPRQTYAGQAENAEAKHRIDPVNSVFVVFSSSFPAC